MNWFEKNDIFTYELDGQLILYSPVARKYAVAAREHIDEFLSCGKYNEVFGPLADYVPVGKQRKVSIFGKRFLFVAGVQFQLFVLLFSCRSQSGCIGY